MYGRAQVWLVRGAMSDGAVCLALPLKFEMMPVGVQAWVSAIEQGQCHDVRIDVHALEWCEESLRKCKVGKPVL